MKRRTALGAAITALVAVVVTIAVMLSDEPSPPTRLAVATPSTPPASLDDLPVGLATSVPWWQHGMLHVGEAHIRTQLRIVLFANGTTVVGRAHVERGSAWFVVRGSSLEPLVTSPGLVTPEVSDDGRTIVWADPVAEDRRRISAYDVTSGTVIGSIEAPVQVTCCDQGGELVMNGVTTDGRVVWSTPWSAVFVWRPGEPDAVKLDLTFRHVSLENWPGGLMWQGESASTYLHHGVLATVSELGAVRRVGKVPTDQNGQWSPDGTSYAYAGQADGRSLAKAALDNIWVQDVATGERLRLDLPTELPFSLVAWESRTTAILGTWLPFDGVDDKHAGLQALARCDTGTGSCERVPGTPTGVPVLPY